MMILMQKNKVNPLLNVCGALLITLVSGVSSAGNLGLSDSPLFLGGSVDPNVMFTLDDSGSMQWETMPLISAGEYNVFPHQNIARYGSGFYTNYVPEFRDNEGFSTHSRSPAFNKMYYDRTVQYFPWSKPDGTSYPNADITCALHNPFDNDLDNDGRKNEVGDDCRDLTTNNNEWAYWVRTNDGISPAAGAYISDVSYKSFWPAVYYVYDGSGNEWDHHNYSKVEIRSGSTYTGGAKRTDCAGITTCTYAEEIQNFANWYSYYRSRILTARAGVGRAFAQQGTNMRVGFATINKGSTNVDGQSSNGAMIDGVRPFSGADRTAWFDSLYGHPMPTAGTPLRRALKYVGQYYERSDDKGPWGEIPGSNNSNAHLTCRQSYNVLMTDGYWNGWDASVNNSDNSSGPTHTHGTTGATYAYSPTAPYKDSHSETLADVAMDYWKRDLRGDVSNQVPVSSADPAFWQHMVTYTVGLGVTGSLNPTTTAAAIIAGTDPSWPDPSPWNADDQKIDDLWHAAVNSRGEFFSAADPDTFATSLSNILVSLVSRTTSAASVALNSGALFSGSSLYQARFDSGTWSGQLLAFPITSAGTLGSQSWDAATLIPTANNRKIVTYNGTSGAPFTWSSTTIGATHQATLGSSNLLNYIRGDDTNEAKNGGSYRNRSVLLGDIVHSAPVYVGPPSAPYPETWDNGSGPESSYSAFRTANTARNSLVYVGANDGMLHAFDGVTGVEMMAYIPSTLMPKLSALSNPVYTHQYYVDGSPTVLDAFFSSDGAWHTVLVSGLRGGGQGVYALDITTPAAGSDTESSIASKVLWEFTDASCTACKDLGYTFSRPNIVRLHNGVWAAVFGNGYNNTEDDDADGGTTNDSTTGDAVLYIVNIETGALITSISTQRGIAEDPTGASRPNGLSTVSPIDEDGDFIVDYIYGGDLFGNVWKFDLTSSNSNAWDIAYKSGSTPLPLFSANPGQAITTRLQVSTHPEGEQGFMIFFGTGKYIEVGDNSQTSQTTQSFYGIWDRSENALSPFTRSDLLQQTIEYEATKNSTEYRTTSSNSIYWHNQANVDAEKALGHLVGNPLAATTTPTGLGIATHLGWYMDIYNTEASNTNNYGERIVADSILRIERVIFPTLIPSSNACDFGGSGWLMELNAADGSRVPVTPFDVNNDGSFSISDYIDHDNNSGTPKVAVSGRKSKVGIIPTPGILSDFQNKKEFKFESGSSGDIEVVTENPGATVEGRQSWIELLR